MNYKRESMAIQEVLVLLLWQETHAERCRADAAACPGQELGIATDMVGELDTSGET